MVEPAATYSRGLPWERLGIEVSLKTSAEMLEAAGLGWKVEVGPLWAGPDENNIKRYPDRYAVYREDTRDLFGIVSKRYQPWDNHEAFEYSDSFVQDGIMRYVRAGSSKGGAHVWLVGQLEEGWSIGEDRFEDFFILSNNHDGGGSIRATFTTIRLHCANQMPRLYAYGRKGQGADLRIRHTTGMHSRLAAARDTLEIMTEEGRRAREFHKLTAETTLDNYSIVEEAAALVTGISSAEEAESGFQRNNLERFQEIWTEENDRSGANVYSLLNTVTGYYNHARHYKGSEKHERRMDSIIWGEARRRSDAVAGHILELAGISDG